MFNQTRKAFGRGTPAFVPNWVPSTPWALVDIPGTTWDDYLKDDGTGVANIITLTDPGQWRSYKAIWPYGGPVYNPKGHEFWMFGGGHAQTTINVLAKANLGSNAPSITVASQPTPEADRRSLGLQERATYIAQGPYYPDGRPYSPHSYWNNMYSAERDEFISFGIGGIATSANGVDMGGETGSFLDIAGYPRSGPNWRADGFYTNMPTIVESAGLFYGTRIMSRDGSKVYYWGDGVGLYRFNFAAAGAGGGTHTLVGGTSARPSWALSLNSDETETFHLSTDTTASSGWGAVRCNLSTGVQTTVTVSGYSIPSALRCYGVFWAEKIGKYVAVWINKSASNAGNGANTPEITTFLVTTLEITGSNTATAALVSTTGAAPTLCRGLTGMGYDPLYECVVLSMAHDTPAKAFRVA